VSAKRRGLKGSCRNFQVKPNTPEAEGLAAVRVFLIVQQLKADAAGMSLLDAPKAEATKTKGRPRSAAPAKMLALYEFDSDHFEALRRLGYGNVPPNKQALDALVKRFYPNDPGNETRLSTLKKTLQRERARKRR
jgi:hypothetical protein